ncbi:CHAT domain-containing protein [Collybia nuda]|uniref:CHAT domain-containing protein n=1 Tax=Collybia nuda TaxID=64659 RepID=A0A9P6CAC5_9AGAR|nr:CHAT domain-containing protein [Collybia nuda]
MDAATERQSIHPYRLQGFSILYSERYKRTGDIKDLEAALECGHLALKMTPEGHPYMFMRLEVLAGFYSDKYRTSGAIQDLDSALKYSQATVDNSPEGHSELPIHLKNLAGLYAEKYDTTRAIDDLKAVIKYAQAAVHATPEGQPKLASFYLYYMASHYYDTYKGSGDIQDLEAALLFTEVALKITPEEDSKIPELHNALAVCYIDKYRKLGVVEGIDTAIEYAQAAVNGTLLGDHAIAERYQSLALCYFSKYKGLGSISDIEAALKCGLAAVAATQEGDSSLSSRLQGIAVYFMERYGRTGDLQDLKFILWYAHNAANGIPEDDPDFSKYQKTLASSYSLKYKKYGDMQDLQKALKYGQKAVEMTSEGHPSFSGHCQGLSVSYFEMFNTTGAMQDLEAAIEYGQAAVDATPLGHLDLAGYQHSLGEFLTNKYHRTGDILDLESALNYGQAAVEGTPLGHPERPTRQWGLAKSYRYKYRRLDIIDDLEVCLKFMQEAVDTTPVGHPILPGLQLTLAIFCFEKYKRFGEMRDLIASLDYAQIAVNATPEGDPDLPELKQYLGEFYASKYTSTREVSDLQAAIIFCSAAVSTTPQGHPHLPWRQHGLALAYSYLYTTSEDLRDLQMAHDLYQSALQSTTLAPQDCWNIALAYTKMAEFFKSENILQIYSKALQILPSLLWLGSSIGVRHYTLIQSGVSEYITKATAQAIQSTHLQTAVEFLEQGLSTTHKQALQLRTEHANLAAELPEQAKRLHKVSAQLQGSSYKFDSSVNHHVLADERLKIIAEIHSHVGFEDFLLPLKYSKLCMAAQFGPVIMLNYSGIQTDAIIILSPSIPPLHVPLPIASGKAVAEQLQNLRHALYKLSIHSRQTRLGRPAKKIEGPSPEALLGALTSWLWNSVVKPIFEVLSENGIINGRLWWCPSGPFTYLPLHAAAPVESQFVQSYTPTLDTLIHAHSKVMPLSTDDILLAVGVAEVSTTLGHWINLPSVEKELDTVNRLFSDHFKTIELKNTDATIRNVFEEMKKASWLHLACHGSQDSVDPLKSGLVLYDGKLELGEILDIALPKAKFVFLSACETAMGDEKLTNEAMHLTGGFIAAGFQGAIGTLWSMADTDGPKVSDIVYQTVLGEKKVPDMKLAAEGLHIAIQKCRRGGAPLHQWMSFIHMGI